MLLGICRLRARFNDLERIRFELWWTGEYAGDLAPIRQFLVGRLEPLVAELWELRDRYDDPFDAAEAAVSGPIRSRDPVLRAMRRFAKTDENLRSAALAIFLDLFGGDVPWESPDTGLEEREPSLAELVERVSGIHRAKTDLLDSGQPLLDESTDIVSLIRAMHVHGVIDLDHPGQAIHQATDDELTQARERARLFLDGVGALVRVYTATRGRDYAGLSVLGRQAVTPDPTSIALTVQLFILLPSLVEAEEGKANAASTFEALASNAVRLKCIRLFVQEHPGYSFMLKPDGPDRVRALPSDERELIVTTFNEFVQRHPECSVLSGAEE